MKAQIELQFCNIVITLELNAITERHVMAERHETHEPGEV